jgi:AbrB family looped-hinge helix DNA binding protein
MKTPFTTKMSSRGQVVIPNAIRRSRNLEEGSHFIVIARGDTIVLHRLKEPPWGFFDDLTKQAARQGKAHDAAMQAFAKIAKKLKFGR